MRRWHRSTGGRRGRWLLPIALLTTAGLAYGQPGGPFPPGQAPLGGSLPPSGGQRQIGFSPGQGTGGRGGGSAADFDALIDLIQSTVAPDSWAENGGGNGDIRPFAGGGVLVNAAGMLARIERPDVEPPASTSLDRVRRPVPGNRPPAGQQDPRRPADLRYVSLPRLERAIAARLAAGRPLASAMLTLAGLRRVQYVLVYPEAGDLVLAGPAGDWVPTPAGRIVASDTREAVVRLDDLVVLLRRERTAPGSHFGCSITPRQESLARAQAFLNASRNAPLPPGTRDSWLSDLRDTLGKQEIEIFGIDPTSRAARVLVEADHHMKLVGLGLEPATEGVRSYLDALERQGGTAANLSVLRWWFTLNYVGLRASRDQNAYALEGSGAQVFSENELLTAAGNRIHTGKSDPLTTEFARSFTDQFAAICQTYPVYSELRNLFDLAVVMALCEQENLYARADWEPSQFSEPGLLRVPQGNVPREVETVINHRVISRRRFVAGVSGGVLATPRELLAQPRMEDTSGVLRSVYRQRSHSPDDEDWWWDAATGE